jgi:transposase-like protein
MLFIGRFAGMLTISVAIESSTANHISMHQRMKATANRLIEFSQTTGAAWTWLHKFRRAMVRPGRELLSGRVEVDECFIGAPEEEMRGRGTADKTLVVVAVEKNGKGIGRIRFKQIPNASSSTLNRFLQESVAHGSVVHTDGWKGYRKVDSIGYEHEVTVLKGKSESASELLPRVHLVISLLKRWLMGTHQGAVSHKHLDYYLDEFTFRFNRRKSMNRGKLFYRLAQQAVAVEPVPLDKILHPERKHPRKLSPRKAPAREANADLPAIRATGT